MKSVIRPFTTMSGWELRELIDDINYGSKYKDRSIYRAELQYVVDEMNRRLKAISKKYNKRFIPYTVYDVGIKRYLKEAK